MVSEGINQAGLAAAVANSRTPIPTPSLNNNDHNNNNATTTTATTTTATATPKPGTGATPLSRIIPSSSSASTTTMRGRGGRGGSSEDIRSRLLSRLGIYGSSPPNGGRSDRTSAVSMMQLQSQPLTAAQHRRVRILRGMGVGYNMFHQSPPDGSATRRPLSGVIPSKEPLKSGFCSDDDDECDDECDDESIVVPDDSDDEDEDDEPREGGHERTASNHNNNNITGENNNSNSNNKRSSGKAKKNHAIKPKTTRIAFQDQVEVMQIPTRHEYSNRIKSRIWSNRYELQENAERNAVEFASEGWNWRNVTEDEGMYICSVSGELVHPAWVGGLPTIDKAAPVVGGEAPAAVGGEVAPGGGGLPAAGAPIGGGGGGV